MPDGSVLGQALIDGFFAAIVLRLFIVTLARVARDTRHRRGGV